jgi:hypothetical protein
MREGNMKRASRWAITLVWLHAVLLAAIAVGCYVAPETVFGDAAWLPLARLGVLLFAAALSMSAIMLANAAASADLRHVGAALMAALVFDVQAPFLLFSLPAWLEYLDRELGVRWWVVPQAFLILIGVSVYTVLSLRRTSRQQEPTRAAVVSPAQVLGRSEKRVSVLGVGNVEQHDVAGPVDEADHDERTVSTPCQAAHGRTRG